MNKDILNDKFFVSVVAILCALLWGSAFPVIKLGYKELNIDNNDIKNIIIFAGVRFFFASILIILSECLWKRRWIYPHKNEIISILIIGIINTFLQYLFFYIGLINTSGTKSSVLNSSITFFTLTIAHFLFREDELTIKKIIGCFLGIIGVLIINFNLSKLFNHNSSNIIITNTTNKNDNINNISFSLIGDGMILLSSLCSALGSILIKIKLTNNKNELFYSYKDCKFIKYLINKYQGFCKYMKNKYGYLKRKLNFQIVSDNNNNSNDNSNNNNSNDNNNNHNNSNEIFHNPSINKYESQKVHYPNDFKFYNETMSTTNLSNDFSLNSNEKTQYLSDLEYDKRKSPYLYETTLRNSVNSYFSNDINDISFIYNDYLYNDYYNEEFEDIEISPPYEEKFKKILEFNNNNNKNSNPYLNTTNKNKEQIYNEIVDLYSYSKDENKTDIIMLTGYQMLFGSLFLNLTGLLINNKNMDIENTENLITFHGLLIIGYMVIITSLAFSLWNILIKYNSVGFLSFFNFLIPLFGILFSGLILNENILKLENLISLILVSLGVIISS